MKNWQKIAITVGILGIGYNFFLRFDTLPYYQLIAIVIGLLFIFRQFKNTGVFSLYFLYSSK